MEETNRLVEECIEFQEALFAGRLSELGSIFTKLADSFEMLISQLAENEQIVLLELLRTILKAYANQDYLLVADLLAYEIQPFAERMCK